jgi:uncharacterized protein
MNDDQNPPEVSPDTPPASDGPERRCILTGERADAASLVRLAISPDGLVLPDVRGKAPGRGAWLGVSGAELDAAGVGKLRGALARAFKGAALTIPEDLADRIAQQLQAATMNRLGLEAKSSNLLTGHEKIATAARSGKVALLLHASDSSNDGRGKLDQAWRVGMEAEGSGKKGTTLPVDREALSMALGRQNAVHAAILGEAAAKRVNHHLARWINFIACDKDAA